MTNRTKLLLTFSALFITPLLAISLLGLRNALTNTRVLLLSNTEVELAAMANHFHTLVDEREHELMTLARGPLPDYIRNAKASEADTSIESASATSVSNGAAHSARQAISELQSSGLYYAELACFDSERHQMLLVQPVYETPAFRTRDFLPGAIEPDESVWRAKGDARAGCGVIFQPAFGDVLRCSAPIFLTRDTNDGSPRGALVADIRLDLLFEQAAKVQDKTAGENSHFAIALDGAKNIVYHPNDALRHQPIAKAMPGFTPVAAAMTPGTEGTGEYRSPEGDTWIVGYRSVFPGLSLAVARNYSLASRDARRAGWLGLTLSLTIGLVAATLLMSYLQTKTERIERVTESVTAIAGGNLDQRVEALSSDELRPLADGVNVMSERLREQAARDAEAHQFESFVKLSALLTHDLKNAIEGLSLTVSNMERHFDNPKFRDDTMKGLASATDKLRALVARISNPVNTLSGEFKAPRPTDLVPLLERVWNRIAEPLGEIHELNIDLPPSLFALVDGERIEKVMENLVLNALESMAEENGKLNVRAGTLDNDKVFFEVKDTGTGMSREFIERRLFHPFATTKPRGVGLGLYTCREVVRANGGFIELQSTEGSGTTFRVVLASASPDNAISGAALDTGTGSGRRPVSS